MNALFPIIRRVRRPLIDVDFRASPAPVAVVVPRPGEAAVSGEMAQTVTVGNEKANGTATKQARRVSGKENVPGFDRA